ncbi:MAG TPA: hypothetical protein ENH40_06960 [Nitrospirae bacterium]|nr:hypothetical protein [Nitrospirota bacterium]
MEIFGVIGILAFIMSFIYLFRPNVVKKFDDIGKIIVENLSKSVKSGRIVSGIFFFAAGVFLAYAGFLWSV